MARKRGSVRPREINPDPKYNDLTVSRFINTIMRQGKRSTAESIFYGALDDIEAKTKNEGIVVFKKAIENVKPMLEVKSRRIGGANYQVPVEVNPARRQSLATRWVVEAARSRSGNSMMEKLSGEFIDASEGRGGAMKKREDVHKMAEANKAFSHFRW